MVDPGGRDGCRAPIPWTSDATHGWPSSDPWLPWPPDAATRNAASQKDGDASMLHLYRRLLAARRKSPALHRGSFSWLESPGGTLAYERSAGQDTRRVAVNFTDAPVEFEVDDDWAADVVSDGLPFTGTLGPYQAILFTLTIVTRQEARGKT